MAYCSNCGQSVGEGANFCRKCGYDLATDERAGLRAGATSTTGGADTSSRTLDDVPRWLGWLAVPAAVLVPLVGLVLYCYWCYRRGRRDGIGREAAREPLQGEDFWKAIFGVAVLLIIPLVGLYAVVALPTICYKQGLRAGAKDEPLSGGFGSGTSLAVAYTALFGLTVGIIWLAVPSGNAQDSSSRTSFTGFTTTELVDFQPTQRQITHCKEATAGYATGLMLDDVITALAARQLTNELSRACTSDPQGTVGELCGEIALTDLVALWKRVYCD